jgi:hypothetical protein
MKINVLIFTGYGASCLNKKVRKLLIDENLCFPYNRIISEDKLKQIQLSAQNVLDDFSKDDINKNQIIRLIEHCDKLDREFYYYNTSTNVIELISIVEVDTSRPWKIENYDGAEYIQYLDYEVKHKDINYCDYKE